MNDHRPVTFTDFSCFDFWDNCVVVYYSFIGPLQRRQISVFSLKADNKVFLILSYLLILNNSKIPAFISLSDFSDFQSFITT